MLKKIRFWFHSIEMVRFKVLKLEIKIFGFSFVSSQNSLNTTDKHLTSIFFKKNHFGDVTIGVKVYFFLLISYIWYENIKDVYVFLCFHSLKCMCFHSKSFCVIISSLTVVPFVTN